MLRTVGPARRLLRSVPFEPVAISIITLGEFAEGFANIHQVEAFLSRFRMIPLSRSIAYKTARSNESTNRSGVWTFALGAAVYGLPPLNGESTEPGITSLGAEVDSPGLAHPIARLSPPPPSFCNAST